MVLVGEIDDFVADGEYVLLGEDGAPFLDLFKDKAYMVSDRFWVNNHAHVLRAGENIENRWLLHWLNTFNYQNVVNGTTRLKLTQAAMNEIPIPVPSPDAGRAIVARIDELFAEIDDGEAALARARSDLSTWRKSLLKAAVTGELTADWRAANPPTETGAALLARILADRRTRWLADPRNKSKRYTEPAAPNVADLPELPPGWVWASLGQLASERERSFQSGPFGSALLHSEFQDSGKLVIGIDNVRHGTFSVGSDHRISDQKFQELARFRARPKDVLVTVMATIGRTCVVPDGVEDAIITKHVYRISLSSEVADAYFVMNALRSNPKTVGYLFGSVQGQTRPGLNKDILETTPIAIGPLAEQAETLCRLNEATSPAGDLLDDLSTVAAATLRQSILAAAFRGDLVA